MCHSSPLEQQARDPAKHPCQVLAAPAAAVPPQALLLTSPGPRTPAAAALQQPLGQLQPSWEQRTAAAARQDVVAEEGLGFPAGRTQQQHTLYKCYHQQSSE